jgi:hypothetical protein
MKKTIALLAALLILLLAFAPAAAFASTWTGDPSQIDEEPADIIQDDEAPDDIYDDPSPATGGSSLILLYAAVSGSALLAAGIALKKRAAEQL